LLLSLAGNERMRCSGEAALSFEVGVEEGHWPSIKMEWNGLGGGYLGLYEESAELERKEAGKGIHRTDCTKT
jgi:hypothetical protein